MNKNSEPLSRRRFISHAVKSAAAGVVLSSTYPFPIYAAPEDNGDQWQIGVFTRPWANLELQFALDAMVEAGFRYAGMMTTSPKNQLAISVKTSEEEAQRIGEQAAKRGLRIASVYGGDFGARESVENGVKGLRKLIDNCAACSSPTLLLGGTNDEKTFEQYYKAVAECCDYGQEKAVQMVLKPHGGLNATGPQCRKTIESVGHPNFRLWYDPGNIFYYSDGKLDPVIDAPSVHGLVTGMCVKDYLPPKNVNVTPGTGRVDFEEVFARLYAGGFKGGPLIIECLAPGEPAALVAEAKKAKALLEKITGQLG